MGQSTATLAGILTSLDAATADGSAIFVTPEGEIGAGYHVTEFKLADIQSIDCGGRRDSWHEAHLQLLDGPGGRHMSVAKFSGIARHSMKALPGLGGAPFFVEFGLNNAGLRRYRVGGVNLVDGHAKIDLVEENALCKPATRFKKSKEQPTNNERSKPTVACCT